MPRRIANAAAALARLPDRFAHPRPRSNGERARLRFGAAGARGEAQAAFPHAIQRRPAGAPRGAWPWGA